jgi:hypothetical protein
LAAVALVALRLVLAVLVIMFCLRWDARPAPDTGRAPQQRR